MRAVKLKPHYSYVIGYVLSLILTLNAYVAATLNVGALTPGLVTMLALLASAQLIVHVIYFLHLGYESRPKWNSVAFIVTVMVLLFIVVGSIWVMNNLDYNMMSPNAQHRMIDDEGLYLQ